MKIKILMIGISFLFCSLHADSINLYEVKKYALPQNISSIQKMKEQRNTQILERDIRSFERDLMAQRRGPKLFKNCAYKEVCGL